MKHLTKHLTSLLNIFTITLLLFLISCDKKEKKTKQNWVTLDLSALDFDEVLVRKLNEKLTFQNHDTLRAKDQKDKIFKMPLVDGEEFGYYFVDFSSSPKTLILSPNERVTLKEVTMSDDKLSRNLSNNNKVIQIDAEGSVETERIEKLIAINTKYQKTVTNRIKTLEDSLGVNNPLFPKFIAKIKTKIQEKVEQDILALINNNQYSFSNIYALEFLNPEKHERLFKKIYNYFKDKTYLSQMLLPRIERMAVNKIGAKAIDFSLPDLNKNMVGLKEYKGKYVMLDFWASWCRPCRDENPNVKKAYEKYKKKGFEVVGISTDRSSIPWKKAVKDDRLTWKQLIDSTGQVATAIYKVNYIPYSILLNPQGEIIAKNLRGHLLEEKLAELLGKEG